MENNKNKIYLDEAYLLFPKPSEKIKEQLKEIRIQTNQHLLNEEKTELKPSRIISLSL